MRSKRPTYTEIPILTYHSIDTTGSVISTAPEVFEQQMRFLASSSLSVLSLGEAVAAIRAGATLSDCVVITFDDGFRNTYEVAYPILGELSLPATVFLVPDHCGKRNDWPGQPSSIPNMPLLDWQEITQMSEHGIEFGAHTMSHPDLSQISAEQAADEILHSKRIIQDRLGKPVDLFAYPYGRLTDGVRRFVAAQFEAACTTQLAFATPLSDMALLPRIDMYYFSVNSLFEQIGTIAFTRYVRWRAILRSLRGRSVWAANAYRQIRRSLK